MFFYILTLFCIGLSSCHADVPDAPPVRCGAMPAAIYRCLTTPKILKPEVTAQCKDIETECEKMTCLFEKSGWMAGAKVDQAKLSAHFEDFAKQNPAWSPAVEHLKIHCLSGDLPAQGIHLNCPAYDAMQCTFASFIKNALPTQWSTASHCEYPRQYAQSCPVCPSDCFTSQIPTGSCNACLSLPRSP